MNRNSYQPCKQGNPSLSDQESVIKQDINIENISDSCLLNTPPTFLTPICKNLRKNLKQKIAYHKNKNESEHIFELFK